MGAARAGRSAGDDVSYRLNDQRSGAQAMCGIFGTYLNHAESIERGLERLRHRGPDGSGIAEARAARHGHVRLVPRQYARPGARSLRQGAGLAAWRKARQNVIASAKIRRWTYRSMSSFTVNYEVDALAPACPFLRLWYS